MVPIARLASGLSVGTRDHSGAFTRKPKNDFHSLFFPINFNSTALFKNAFLMVDLAGRRLFVILSSSNLVPVK